MNETTATRKPTVDFAHVDGNVFSIIGTVARALKDAGQRDRADEFRAKAMKQHTYDDVIALCFDYVDVQHSGAEDDAEECWDCGAPIDECECE